MSVHAELHQRGPTTRRTRLGVQESIDQIGFGRFQRRLPYVCGVTWAADGAGLLAIGFALPSIQQEFGLSLLQAGVVASAAFIGMLAGAPFWERSPTGSVGAWAFG